MCSRGWLEFLQQYSGAQRRAHSGRRAAGGGGAGGGVPVLGLLGQEGEDVRVGALGAAPRVLQEALVVALHLPHQRAQLRRGREYGQHLDRNGESDSPLLMLPYCPKKECIETKTVSSPSKGWPRLRLSLNRQHAQLLQSPKSR